MGSPFKKRSSTQGLIEKMKNNKNIPEEEKGSVIERLEQLKEKKDELEDQIDKWTRGGREQFLKKGGKEKHDKEDELQEKLNKQEVELEWRKTHRYADNITLDADTAHPNLSIAEDKKSLTHEVQPQKVQPAPERFDSTVCVLGSQGFSNGKHYWEVEIVDISDWDLGVANKSIQRQGKLFLCPKEGFWVLGLNGRDYWAKTDPWTQVKVQKKPKKIGVYLSYEEGQVTFFNVTDMSVLFTFKDCSFSGEVCPFFKNSHKRTTLRICSIREEEGA